jgi:Fe-S-cluster containining protein
MEDIQNNSSAHMGCFRFLLREEILFDGLALHDPLTGNTHRLSECGRVILGVLHSGPTAEEVIYEITRNGQFDRAVVGREIRQIMLLGLFEGTCVDIRARFGRIRRGEIAAARALSDSRFRCQGSGECCRGYVFGPISKEEKSRIEALNPRQALPQLGNKQLFEAMGAGSGSRGYKLATTSGACVFLEAGLRCGLHRAFGADAKPALCQLYPLAAAATIDGLKVYDRGECATFAVSAQQGTFLADELPKIRALADRDLYHPAVRLYRSWTCDYGLVLALADRLDSDVRPSPPLQALHDIGHVVRGFILALTSCPLEEGQPESAASQALARPAGELRPSAAAVATNARSGLGKLATLATALAERAAPTERHTPLFVQATSLLAEICEYVLHGRPLSPSGDRALAIATEADTDRALALSLRHQVFGRDLLLDGSLPAGLLRMALVVVVSLAGSRILAREERAAIVTPRQLSLSHMIVKRTLNRPEPLRLLRANGQQAWPVLDSLPLLAPALIGRPGAR